MSTSNNQVITCTGDLTPENINGRSESMHLYRSQEYRQFLEAHNQTVLAISASGCLGLNWQETLANIREDEDKWIELLRLELEALAEPGNLDMNTHLITITSKP